MQISVFKTIEDNCAQTSHRTSDGYLYSCYITRSISIFSNKNCVYKSLIPIFELFIKTHTSNEFDRNPVRYEDSYSLTFCPDLTHKLACIIMEEIQDVEYVYEVEIILPNEEFYNYSPSMEVIDDQKSHFIKIKKDYLTDLEVLKKDFFYKIIESTIDRSLNDKHIYLENNYPLDIAYHYKDPQLTEKLVRRGAFMFKQTFQLFLFFLLENKLNSSIISLYNKSRYLFDDLALGLIVHEAILNSNDELIKLFPFLKINPNKLYLNLEKQSFIEVVILEGTTPRWIQVLGYGAKTNEGFLKSRYYFNAISLACLKKDVELLKALANVGAEFNNNSFSSDLEVYYHGKKFDFRGNHYLYLAILYNNDMVFSYLLAQLTRPKWYIDDLRILIEDKKENILKKIFLSNKPFEVEKEKVRNEATILFFLKNKNMEELVVVFERAIKSH